jgi:hypothetical protein
MFTFASSPSTLVSNPILFQAVNNFMDYADDACMTNFTPGQNGRLKDQLRAFREIYL